MARLMGLDVGSRTVGIAVSDELGWTAQGVEIIKINEEEAFFGIERVKELVEKDDVCGFVLGLPKNMNNTIGERAEKSLQLKETLERRLGLPVVMWDERLTTVEANRTLMESGVRRENRGKYVDMIAAVFILQGYLDAKANPGTL